MQLWVKFHTFVAAVAEPCVVVFIFCVVVLGLMLCVHTTLEFHTFIVAVAKPCIIVFGSQTVAGPYGASDRPGDDAF